MGHPAEAIPTKDIAIAVLTGSLALAAVLVVFIGFLVAHAETVPAEVPDKIRNRFTGAAKWGLVPMLGAAGVTLASYAWLFFPTCPWLFTLWSFGFSIVVAGFMVYAVISILMI